MSEILARFRVRETHGIRRFLYPLSAAIELPVGADVSTLGLSGSQGDAVPLQFTPISGTQHRLDFALSLSPSEERIFQLVNGGFQSPVNDPLHFVRSDSGGLQSRQDHFNVSLASDGNVEQVVYDGVAHLQKPTEIANIIWLGSEKIDTTDTTSGGGPLTAWLRHDRAYQGVTQTTTTTEITACKSWVKQIFRVETPDHSGLFSFSLHLKTASQPLMCDFGVGGGVYSKLQPYSNGEIVWMTEFKEDSAVRWSIATDKRVDYVGEVASVEAFRPQAWFHMIDSDKALAVALTHIPDTCKELEVQLSATGRIQIEFRLGKVTAPIELGVCYHFLNDVPAIAAATNPQSIILPPTVAVLPM